MHKALLEEASASAETAEVIPGLVLKRASRVCAEVCVRALPAEVLHCGCVTVDSDWNLVLCVCVHARQR